jgi:hypothetical protein
MLKKITLSLLVFCSASLAVDAATILANQKKASFPDTAEIRIRTTVTMQGMPSQAIESRLLTKGKEKMVTEMKSPLMNIKMIRNGEQLSVTDLKTGATLPSQAAGQPGMQGIEQDFGKPEDYSAPVKEGNLWRLSPKNPAGAILFYSEEQKRVVKIQQAVQPGVQSETSIKYCGKECALSGTPVSIDIATQVNGQTTAKILLEILSAQKLTNVPDAMFAVPKK